MRNSAAVVSAAVAACGVPSASLPSAARATHSTGTAPTVDTRGREDAAHAQAASSTAHRTTRRSTKRHAARPSPSPAPCLRLHAHLRGTNPRSPWRSSSNSRSRRRLHGTAPVFSPRATAVRRAHGGVRSLTAPRHPARPVAPRDYVAEAAALAATVQAVPANEDHPLIPPKPKETVTVRRAPAARPAPPPARRSEPSPRRRLLGAIADTR